MHQSLKQRQFFGTDGIRGTANRHPLTPEFVLHLGQAVGALLVERHVKNPFPVWPHCVIGKDTRVSGGMLESALAAGLASVGVDVALVGVVPTPAVAFLTRDLQAALGVVISASHNPYPDNGIKFFSAGGFKLDDSEELEIERRVLDLHESGTPALSHAPEGGKIGRLGTLEDAVDRYVHFVLQSLPGNEGSLLRGIEIVLDPANGAACKTSPAVLRHLGATVRLIHSEPNGVNINAECGCTHPESLQEAVRETAAQAAPGRSRLVGIAHDGDADRVLLCDETGVVVDGDEIMAIVAVDMIEEGALAENTLVTTVMSNLGLDELVETRGGSVFRTEVGDRYVLEKMRAENLNFGGEQSGHFLFLDHSSTGDGIIAALQVLKIMVKTGKPLSELRRILTKFPQAQRNISVSSKPPIEELAGAQAAIADTKNHLGGAGRLLLRYSGTEPKIRLLIEGKDDAYINTQADTIAAALAAEIGVP